MEKKKPDIFQLLFIIPPVIILSKFASEFAAVMGVNNILLAAILGGAGALLGLAFYHVVHKKNQWIKIGAVVIELMVLFAIMIWVWKK